MDIYTDDTKSKEVQLISPSIFKKVLEEIQELEELWPVPIVPGKDNLHFSKELNKMMKILEKSNFSSDVENSMRYLILSYAYSLTRKKRYKVKPTFQKVNKKLAMKHFPNLYTYLKFTLLDFRNILIVTHFKPNDPKARNYFKILGFNRFIDKKILADFESFDSLIDLLGQYKQVFFVGHESLLKIEGLGSLEPSHFKLRKKYDTEVIGFFNCKNRFIDSDIMGELFDVIFHDDQSVPDYNEFFLAKYLYEYINTLDLFNSIDRGKLTMWLKNATSKELLNVRINGTDVYKLHR